MQTGREPRLRGGDVGWDEGMARDVCEHGHVGPAGTQQRSEARRVIGPDHGIVFAVLEEDAFARERAGRGGLVEHDHGTEENGGTQRGGAQEQQRGGDIGPVGETNCGEPRGVEAVLLRGGGEKIGERVRAARDLSGIEHALGEAREKAPGAALAHVAARAEQRRAGRKRATEAKQILLVSSRPVEQQERRGGGDGAGFEDVVIGEGHLESDESWTEERQ